MKKISINKRCWIVDDDNICHSGRLHHISLSAVIPKILPELRNEYLGRDYIEYLEEKGRDGSVYLFLYYLEQKYAKQ